MATGRELDIVTQAEAKERQQKEQQERPDDCGNEPRAFAGGIPADLMADPSGNECARNSEQDGDDATARVLARHE